MSYARGTIVPIARSKAEIEELVVKYGATQFATMSTAEMAQVAFKMSDRLVRFNLPLPKPEEFKYYKKQKDSHYDYERTAPVMLRMCEQAARERWRALVLIVKAKLQAVESGVTTFEEEFLAHIVTPNGKTVGEWITPQLAEIYQSKRMPPMLTAGGGA